MTIAKTNLTTQELQEFSDVNATALLMLYARAMESCSEDPILKDEQAERIVSQIDPLLAGSGDRFLSMLYNREIEPSLVVHAALRARKYDQYALEFLSRHPDSVIANLGCGMDTRYQRIDDGEMTFFDLDLPAMVRFKRRVLQESERYRMIADSVLETGWMEQVGEFVTGPALFLVEGLLMYLEPHQVTSLVLKLQDRFPGSELVCEVANRRWIGGILGSLAASKMQRQLKLGKGAQFKSGLESPDEMEGWHAGIQYLEQWSYFDTRHPKLGWMRILGDIEPVRGVQYTVRYRLNPVA